MAIKLYKRGKFWWMDGTIRGISVRKSTKTEDAGTAETVRIILEQQLLEESLFGKRVTATFGLAAEAYLEQGGSNRFLAPLLQALGKREIRTIKQIDLDGIAKKLHPGAAASTLNRQVYTPFIAVWNHAVVNEWADLKKWKRPSARKGTLLAATSKRTGGAPVSYDRAATFISSLPPAPAMIFTALFYTGMRPIELLALCKKDVSVANRWILVRSSKTGEPRGVPMHEILVPLFDSLSKRTDSSPQIFRSFKGKPYRVAGNYGGQLSSSIDNARRASGIDDISAYTARHTVSTQLVINGVHQHVKDQILGHASDSMSRHYTNVPQSPLIEAINTLPVPEFFRGFWWWTDPLRASRAQSIMSARV